MDHAERQSLIDYFFVYATTGKLEHKFLMSTNMKLNMTAFSSLLHVSASALIWQVAAVAG